MLKEFPKLLMLIMCNILLMSVAHAEQVSKSYDFYIEIYLNDSLNKSMIVPAIYKTNETKRTGGSPSDLERFENVLIDVKSTIEKQYRFFEQIFENGMKILVIAICVYAYVYYRKKTSTPPSYIIHRPAWFDRAVSKPNELFVKLFGRKKKEPQEEKPKPTEQPRPIPEQKPIDELGEVMMELGDVAPHTTAPPETEEKVAPETTEEQKPRSLLEIAEREGLISGDEEEGEEEAVEEHAEEEPERSHEEEFMEEGPDITDIVELSVDEFRKKVEVAEADEEMSKNIKESLETLNWEKMTELYNELIKMTEDERLDWYAEKKGKRPEMVFHARTEAGRRMCEFVKDLLSTRGVARPWGKPIVRIEDWEIDIPFLLSFYPPSAKLQLMNTETKEISFGTYLLMPEAFVYGPDAYEISRKEHRSWYKTLYNNRLVLSIDEYREIFEPVKRFMESVYRELELGEKLKEELKKEKEGLETAREEMFEEKNGVPDAPEEENSFEEESSDEIGKEGDGNA